MRGSVHSNERNLKEIKRRNEILVDRLCKIKPVVSSQVRLEKFSHLASNSKKRWINYSKSLSCLLSQKSNEE